MQNRIDLFFAILFLLLVPSVQAAEKVTYETDVKPILREHCFACHNQDDAESSLALDSFEGLTTGGASGEVVAAGDLDSSRLWKLVTHQEEPTMPPDNKLPEKQLQVLRAWIEGGLLENSGSKPMKSKKPAIAKIDASKLGQPVGEPAMPEQLFHEPVLWTSRAGPVDALATSPWAPLVAVAWQRQISLYNTDTYELLGIVPYVDGVPRVVRFSRDSSLVLVAGGRHAAAGSATLFDVKTGVRLTTLGDELDIVLSADISPDLSLVALGGPKKKVRVYRVADGTLAYQISKHTEWITAIGFSPDGKMLATADRNGGALLWQATVGHERADLRGHKGAITSLDWRADSAMLATASEDGTVRLWNPAGQQLKSVTAHSGGVLSVRFSQTGNWVSAGRDHKIKVWKSDGGAIADMGKMPGMALAAAFTHDGAKVIASDYTGEVRVIDTESKKRVAMLQANPQRMTRRLTHAEKHLQETQKKLQISKNHLATLLAALTQGQETHAAHEKKLAKTQATLVAKRKKQEVLSEEQNDAEKLAAEKSVQAAEATLAQVSNETSGLPDLVKLTEQHKLSQTEVAAAQQQLQQAQQTKAIVVAQQEHFAQALAQFADQAQLRLTKQQELAKQSEQLEVEHQQAAKLLSRHRANLSEVVNQLKTIQAKLTELQSAETTLQEQESKLTVELAKVQLALTESQQQLEQLKTSKQDFAAAEVLRKAYATSEKP